MLYAKEGDILNSGLLICLLLGHFVSDFIFQSDSIVESRYNKDKKIRRKANLSHTTRYFFITNILSLYYLSLQTAIGIMILAVLHFLIDSLKTEYGIRKPISKYRLAPFFIDQLSHFITILAVSIYLSTVLPNVRLLSSIVNYIIYFISTYTKNFTYADKVLLSILLFVIGVWGIGYFIRLFFYKRKYKKINSKLLGKTIEENSVEFPKSGTEDGGFIIGILERIFIICAIVIGLNEVVGFALATKSIARFKKFDDDKFVEDFIIGSFISFISAIVIGILIKALKIYYVIGP